MFQCIIRINLSMILVYILCLHLISWPLLGNINFSPVVKLRCIIIFIIYKVEKILKGSLDSILSPSRSCEHLNFWFSFFWPNIVCKKFVDNAKQCFAFTPQANFTAHNLNFG